MVQDYPDYTLPVVHVGAITVEGSVSVLGTVEVKGAVTVSGTVSVSGTVEVTGSVTVSGTVSITGTVTISGDVYVTNATIDVSGSTVSISGTVTVTGSVTVSGTVSISGTVTVTGSVTVSGTVSITGTVTVTGAVTVSGTVHVDTIAADNIIIDKLTVGAYVSRRSTLSNNGETASWAAVTGDERKGKFFPRGCRGFLGIIEVYCRNTTYGDQTLTVYISPHPSMGYVASATIDLPEFSDPAWRNAVFNRMWNYDSLFIFCVGSHANVGFGYDTGTPRDCFYSGDAGASWVSHSERWWFRAVMEGETVGDLPVSGTINTIEIPAVSSQVKAWGDVPVPSQEAPETVIASVEGAGTLNYIKWQTTHDAVGLRPYCDGNRMEAITPEEMNTRGFGPSTPYWSLTRWTEDADCDGIITAPYKFKRKFELRAIQTTGVAQTVRTVIVADMIT